MTKRSTAFARGLTALLITTSILQLNRASASPGDIFEIPAPAIGADPPKAAELRVGDASVSTQTGALQYRYAIQVPPGRNGMAPSLALTYSSQGPTYGGIAAGWSLPVGMIRADTSRLWLPTRAPLLGVGNSDPKSDDRFVVGESRLVAVGEPHAADVYATYRIANGDTSYTRYERLNNGQWRARMTDGSTSYFGEPSFASTCTTVTENFAPLTRTIDVFGNEVDYFYESVLGGECRLKKITWGQNPNASLPSEFAQVVFNYQFGEACAGSGSFYIGAQRDYRSGTMIVTGGSRLSSIVVTAFPPGQSGSPSHTRTVTLGYTPDTEGCGSQHAPVRLLTSIQESAVGTDSPLVTLPPVTFDYGDVTTNLSQSAGTSAPWSADAHPSTLGWGFRRAVSDDRWPSVEAMMIDIDGDGLLDRLVNTSVPGTTGQCTAAWQRNLGPTVGSTLPAFSGFQSISLPRLKWKNSSGGLPLNGTADSNFNEGCSLNGQVTAFENSVPSTLCHNNTSCAAGPTGNPGPYCYPNGTECPNNGAPVTPYRTYLAYRWLDADGDGLVDLVAAVHGDIGRYDVDVGYLAGQPVQEPTIFGAWPACPGTAIDACKQINVLCANPNHSCSNPDQPCSVDWVGMKGCVDTAIKIGCQPLLSIYMAPGHPPTPGSHREAYTRCEGLYPWMIYKNNGNGGFSSTPTIKYQPVPLESDSGDSNFTGATVASLTHTLMDFDGDGFLDGVARPLFDDQNNPNPWWWQVWLGNGTGGLAGTRFIFPTRDNVNNAIFKADFTQSGQGGSVTTVEALQDLNGDGLPDHWIRPSGSSSANVVFNIGTELQLFQSGGFGTGFDLPPNLFPTNDTSKTITSPSNWVNGQTINAGQTVTLNRIADVDGDGRIDIVQWPTGQSPSVNFNVGGSFIPGGVSYPGNTGGLQRMTKALNEVPLRWELDGDLIDLDGDGIAESVSFDATGFHRFERPTGTPPRLLQAIHNGRGANLTATYAQMHDATTVEQHPELTWFDGRPKATPREQWVVKSLVDTDGFSGTTSTTSYMYRNPRHGADDEGRFAFRGFEEVVTTAPTGMKTKQRYSYDPDWSGRLSEVVVLPAQNPGETTVPDEVRSISRATWSVHTLFSGAVKTFHTLLDEKITCANGQTESACNTNPAAYTRTESTLLDFPLVGTKLLALETGVVLKKQSGNADGDRQTLRTFDTLADATTYRVRPRTATREHRVAGTMTMFAKSDQTWDPTLAFKLTDEVWFDAVDANRAITRLVTDAQTGNVLERWKPVQNALGSTKTSFVYDSRKLFVATETNELGHVRDYTWEYGTGTKLQTDGPNVRTCTSGCGSGPVKEQTKIRIDGIGRPIELWETASTDGATFTLYQRETTSYVDAVVVPTTPSSSTHRVRETTSPTSNWTQTKSDVDGHGRPIKNTEYVYGTAPFDAVTQFAYRNDGTLQSVSVPDPSLNNASLVAYNYTFDSLGRATSIRRPDSTTPANQSGADISYDGVTKTVTEVVGIAGGNPASTKTITDSFGRLIEVHERTAITPLTFAITHYTYGPDDNVITVVDPENVTTQMQHDFAGHRTQITRYGRAWKYGYDKNGNVSSEIAPSPNPPATDPAYTTTIVYDDLDRVASKAIGQRALSAPDQALFATGTEQFTWDSGGNMKGRLATWKTFAPSNPTPAITRTTFDTDQGAERDRKLDFNIDGLVGSREITSTFTLSNKVSSVTFNDTTPGASGSTLANYVYDARGALQKIGYVDQGVASSIDIGVQTRNVAGLVTKRSTTLTSPALVESNWTYDKLGRVTSQVVQKKNPTVAVARQDLTLLGNDDPSALTHWLATSSKQFQFGYDLRHQLTSANETSTPGYFTSSYSYGAGGRFTNANLAQPTPPSGSDLKPRNVNYVYADPDPERVTSLVTATNGVTYATYTYDEAGNQTSRCLGATASPCSGESLDYVYDGKNQLRRVTKKLAGATQGSEEYWYDGDGARVSLITRSGAGAKTETIWFLGGLESHYNSAGSNKLNYAHLEMGTPAARVTRASLKATVVEYQFHGLASSLLAAVSNTGTTNVAFSYSPFGEVLEAVNGGLQGTAVHPHRFNDKYQDSLSSLSYYGHRYLDRTLIGWTQSDPLYRFEPDFARAQPRRAALYTSDLNNPLRYLDPDGRNVGVIVGALVDLGVGLFSGAAGAISTFIITAVGFATASAQMAKVVSDIPDEALIYIAETMTGTPYPSPPEIPSWPTTPIPDPTQPKVDWGPQLPGPNTQGTGVTVAPKIPRDPNHPEKPTTEESPDDDIAGEIIEGPGKQGPLAPARDNTPRPWWKKIWEKISGRPGVAPQQPRSQPKPADANKDGQVTDEEESWWMRND